MTEPAPNPASGPTGPTDDPAAPTPAASRRVTAEPQAQTTGPRGIGPDPVVLRPRALLISAWVAAATVVAIFAVVAYLLPDVDTGVYFRVADQVSMMVLGLLIAGGLLLMARPRVRADAGGIEIRNIGPTHWYPWSDVEGIAFPDGASWARIDLPDDEYLPVLAVQAVDRQHAVRAIRQLRDLFDGSGPGRA